MNASSHPDRTRVIDDSRELTDRITAQVFAERIYLYPTAKGRREIRMFFIIIRNTPSQHITETIPLVNFLLAKSPGYAAQVAYANEVKEHLKYRNLKLCLICRNENLVYVNPESTDELTDMPEMDGSLIHEHQAVFHTEMRKIDAFREGAEFYLQKGELPHAAFMMHQVVELGFRTAEKFITGKNKITHSIRSHQQFIRPYSEELGKLFDPENGKEVKLLDKLDEAYKATRYGHKFKVSEKKIQHIMAKARVQRDLIKTIFSALIREYERLSAARESRPVAIPPPSNREKTGKKD